MIYKEEGWRALFLGIQPVTAHTPVALFKSARRCWWVGLLRRTCDVTFWSTRFIVRCILQCNNESDVHSMLTANQAAGDVDRDRWVCILWRVREDKRGPWWYGRRAGIVKRVDFKVPKCCL